MNGKISSFDRCELEIQGKIQAEIDQISSEIDSVNKKYEDLKQSEISRCNALKEKERQTLSRSEYLINNINRKLFAIQRRDVDASRVLTDKTAVLNELSKLIDQFDSTDHEVFRDIKDSILVKVKSDYKQEEVDRIVMLYETLKVLATSQKYDDMLESKLSEIEASRIKEVDSIKAKIRPMVQNYVDEFISAIIYDVST